MSKTTISRRTFLKTGAIAGQGLLLGFYFPGFGSLAALATKPMPGKKTFAPNAWLRVQANGTVTVMIHKSEMGQGVLTSIPMLVADELDADWEKVRYKQAPAAPAYASSLGGMSMQFTGGSSSVRGSWEPLREAGAAARQMLVAAAAHQWGVSPATLHTEKGEVIGPGGKRLSYGELADKAAAMPVPKEVRLKKPGEFKFIGQPVARLDVPAKINGSGVFGIDVKLPGMLVARVLHCPVFGGKVAKVDDTQAKAIEGVHAVVPLQTGVAVVADGYWQARQGLEALVVEWDEGPNANQSSEAISRLFRARAGRPGATVAHKGNAELVLMGGGKRVNADYEVPFLAHATMEPMNCTADVRDDGVDLWAPTQAQTFNQMTGAKLTGLPPSAIRVHTTLLGGGFGRRFEQDFVAEAILLSKAVGKPVKVIWSREDDMQHDFYRPAYLHRFAASLDKDGWPVAWHHRIVGPSIMSRVFPGNVKDGIDPTSIEGAFNIPYTIPNLQVEYDLTDTGIPVGFWRSVGSSHNAYAVEGFLDEVAAAGGKDPYELRLHLLPKVSRHRGVLELAATKAGWGQPLPKGRFRGIAVAESFGSYVAQVAEVSVAKDGEVRVHRVVCAVDCGIVVNPDTVQAQMQGAIVYGLTAALKGAITIDKGRVQQSNFHDYQMLRINEMPEVEVHILPSEAGLGGIGEPGVPPIAPAVCNAIFAATGKPVRKLPIDVDELKKA